MPSPTLTTLAEFKTHLGIASSDTSQDTRLTQFLVGVEEAVKNFCREGLKSETVTEYYDGSGRELLVLRRRPLTAVSSVRVDAFGRAGLGADAFPEESAWEIGEDFFPKRVDQSEGNGSILIAVDRAWPEGRGNIKVVYTAGYASIPEDLKLGIHTLAAFVKSSAAAGLMKGSETIGRYSYSLLTGANEHSSGIDVITARSLIATYAEVDL